MKGKNVRRKIVVKRILLFLTGIENDTESGKKRLSALVVALAVSFGMLLTMLLFKDLLLKLV